MKKITLLSVALLALFSCQKHENTLETIPSNADEAIVGKWKVDAVQLWNGNDIQEIHTPQQTLEFTSEGLLIVTGPGVGGTTLTDTVNYTYTTNSDMYFLRIVEESRIYQGCLLYLRQKDGVWSLGFSRPAGTNTDILWNYHCVKI